MYKIFVFGDLVKPVPRGFSVQDLKLFISYINWFSDMKFINSDLCINLQISDLKFINSDLDIKLQISDLKFGSEWENFRSEITLKNKTWDLKSDWEILC